MRSKAQAGLDPSIAFWIAVALVGVAYLLPVGVLVNRPLYWLGTLFHELGHGLGAMITGGEFSELVVDWEGGGRARVRYASDGAHLVLLVTGLLGPALAGAIGFVMARGRQRARIALAACALLLAWAILFKVRTAAGLIVAVPVCWTAATIAISGRHAQVAVMVLSVLLALNSWQDRHYMLSDAPNADIVKIADIVGAPVWLMGVLCVGVSLAVLGFGVYVALRTRRRTSPIGSGLAPGSSP